MKLNDMLAYKVAMLASDLSESLACVYAPYQLTMPQWRIMATLGERKTGSLNAKEIVKATRLDKVKVTRALQALAQKGFIEKAQNNQDGRLINVCLTSQGLDVFEAIRPLVEQWQKERLKAITDDEYRIFLKVIDALTP
ncbi:MarR family winged helix-turn-helix transcriptional regulator [Alteromonas sp. D210916BOD_24]|uniref:MarR family winged helix-turn-helix transcriptional regulator n=1 Tax=Alteromonas sp. D210916BOD_24 TaxID=3157618 RepID=UPI00399C7B6F